MKLRRVDCPKNAIMLGPVIPNTIVDSARDAEQLMRQTEQEIERIIAEAHKRAADIEHEAREAVVAREAEEIAGVIEVLNGFMIEQRAQFENVALELSKTAIKKLALQAPSKNKLQACINLLIDEIAPAIPMKLHVAVGCEEEAQTILNTVASARKKAVHAISIIEDGSLSVGDAALVTPTGARIQCRFDQMIDKLLNNSFS